MHTQIAFAPNGIPFRFSGRSEPLAPSLRRTLGLKLVSEEKPAIITFPKGVIQSEPKVASIPRVRISSQYKSAGAEEDLVYRSKGKRRSGEDKIFVMRGHFYRPKFVEQPMQHTKVTSIGKRVPHEVEAWDMKEKKMVTRVEHRCEQKRYRFIDHQSHGKHGRKPTRKDKHAPRISALLPGLVCDLCL